MDENLTDNDEDITDLTMKLDQNMMDEFNVSESEEDEEVKFVEIEKLMGSEFNSMNLNIKGRISKIYPEKKVNGRLATNKNCTYWQMIMVLTDENLENTIKITFWNSKVWEILALKPKLFDVLEIENGQETKDETDFLKINFFLNLKI